AAVRGLYDAFAAEIDVHSTAGPRKVSHGLNDTLVNSLELGIGYAAKQHLIAARPTVADVFADAAKYLDLR
ncbi:MAG TPA: hypothetical protein VHZ97_20565, partial [Pseudonocardiaceae bacterium]|nr:hypothetical protein [Pseudonocardiaceae bacterium]